ncbi:MAG TPA: hypothetical protein DDY17_05265 [Syntrophaceae bacterium]|jgi:PAS domain S-box-containing protein|nr:hypothetical protein [Syntrophaceae bacterium]
MGDLMKDDNKTKKQLVHELAELRSQNAAFKKPITGSKSYELVAEEANHYAESIVETVREPLLVLDADLRIISANRNFYRTFKVTLGETIGSFIYELGNKQWDIPKLRELLEEVLPEKEVFDDFEVAHNFQDIGHKIMLLNARQILYRKDIGAKMILLAIEDITEHRRLESLLEESEERYRRLFETASDGIVLLEKREGKITHANPATEKILGYKQKESIGNKLRDIGVLLDIGDFQTTMQNLNKIGILNYDNVSVKTKSGQHIYTDIYLVDRARLVQCNIRDITDRKLAEEALRKSERELKSKTENLEEVNAALNVLLKRVEEGRIELEEKILSNIRELVLPYIDRLKKTQLSDHQASYLIVIETNLDNIASSFLYHLKLRYLNLTHREVQVASLIKEGKSTKEIANLLNIAIKTVVFHRNSLRKKLALKNQKANLRAHLLTFT